MELSEEVHNLLQRYKTLQRQSEDKSYHGRLSSGLNSALLNDSDFLMYVNELSFNDDETWLYESPTKHQPPVKNLHQWLYKDFEVPKNEEFHTNRLQLVREITKIDTKKTFDSRTFTRPKKRFSRPSIEKYSENCVEVTLQNGSAEPFKLEDEQTNQNEIAQEESPVQSEGIAIKPLNFDLSQPTTSSIFDKIVASAGELDSFQNMSPPSLVNSMCSSTFTNLMENSYIKNDPVLREIRDTDFSDTVLLQDSETPMFQSLTESYSSLNSESIDSFIKKHTSVNGTFTKNSLNDTYSTCDNSLDDTIRIGNVKKDQSDKNVESDSYKSTEDLEIQNFDPNILSTPRNINGTYRKMPKINMTFKKLDCTDDLEKLSSTFKKLTPKSNALSDSVLNASFDCNMLNNKMSNSESNKLNKSFDDCKDAGRVYSELSNTINIKSNSIGYLTGSADSLDHISSLSNSSRGSNKMLNMAEVDAIVELQEQSLQIISSPKHFSTPKPITTSEHLTDSDDDYTTVRSSLSKASSLESENEVLPVPNQKKPQQTTKRNLRSVNTLATDSKLLQAQVPQLRGSCTNLRNAGENLKNSYANIYKSNTNLRGSCTNLKSVKPSLCGSYTSLKPSSTNLPVVPPLLNPKSLSTSTVNKVVEPNQRVERPNSTRESNQKHKASGLPRPLSVCTGIPRPVSKIPGPRSVKSATSRSDTRSNKLNGCY